MIETILAVLRSNEFQCVAYEHGQCLNTITASIEHETGDFGTRLGSSLVFSGKCADLHGYNDDSHNYWVLAQRYSERKQLLRKVKQIINVTQDLNPIR